MGHNKISTNHILNKTNLSLENLALNFINNSCEDLRFDKDIEEKEKSEGYKGTSLKNFIILLIMIYK